MQRAKVRRLASATVCAALLVGLGSPSMAGQKNADGKSQAKRDKASAVAVAEVRRELAESSEVMVQAAADLRAAQTALARARKTAATAHSKLLEARERQAETTRQRLESQTQLMIATQRADESALRVDEHRGRLGRVARAAYQQGGTMGTVTAIFEANSPADFTERLVAFDHVATAQRHVLEDLQAAQKKTQANAEDFELVRDEIAAAHEQAQINAEKIDELVRTTTAAELEVERLVRVQQGALAAAMAAQAEDERRLLELQGESNKLSQLLAQQAKSLLGLAGARSGASYLAQKGVLGWPVLGPLTSPFGMRVHPVTGVHKLHSGTDFGLPCGSPIAASRAGTVIAAGFNRAYGWRTVISHGVVGEGLLTTTYNHQTNIGVEVGQQVKRGQTVGTVGTTGYSTGCHLHFELIINSDMVDPMPWLLAG